eukprot:SAG11_NODE_1822_length_4207_cov_1.736125_4_plen_221_part_00
MREFGRDTYIVVGLAMLLEKLAHQSAEFSLARLDLLHQRKPTSGWTIKTCFESNKLRTNVFGKCSGEGAMLMRGDKCKFGRGSSREDRFASQQATWQWRDMQTLPSMNSLLYGIGYLFRFRAQRRRRHRQQTGRSDNNCAARPRDLLDAHRQAFLCRREGKRCDLTAICLCDCYVGVARTHCCWLGTPSFQSRSSPRPGLSSNITRAPMCPICEQCHVAS